MNPDVDKLRKEIREIESSLNDLIFTNERNKMILKDAEAKMCDAVLDFYRSTAMKYTVVVSILLLLAGCGYAKSDLDQAFEDGYKEGYMEAESKFENEIDERCSEAYREGLIDGASSVECPDADEIWMEAYTDGLYDGYQERKKDETAGAPDYYEKPDEWFYFWYGMWPEDIPPP